MTPHPEPLPLHAAWRHRGSGREGFEIATFTARTGVTIETTTCATEGGAVWQIEAVIRLDEQWRTQRAEISRRAGSERRDVMLERDGRGWRVDGRRVIDFADCLDIDLESSVVTNTVPVHRLGLAVGESVPAPALFVAVDLGLSVLDQTYARLADPPSGFAFGYEAPAFGVARVLRYDAAGLVVDYPEIARRVL